MSKYLKVILFLFSAALAVPSFVLAKPISIVTTTNMIADLVRNVGGEEVEITTLMGPGVDPHLYKATQGDLRRLTEGEVVFYNGLHLEGKMVDIFEKIARNRPVYAVSEDIDRSLLRAPPEFAGNYDPHIWFDVSLWVQATKTITKRLSEYRPEKKDYFEKNLQAYTVEMLTLHEWVKGKIASIPSEQRILITAHDAFGYFGQAYGIRVLGLQGISTASEFGLHDVKHLVDIIIDKKVKAIFVESSVPQRFVLSLQEGVKARGGSVAIGGQLYSDSMDAPGTPAGTYLGMIKTNVETIVKALS